MSFLNSTLNANVLHGTINLKAIGVAVGCCSTVWLFKQLYDFHKLAKGVNYLPGPWALIHGPILPRFLPEIRGINRGYMWPWKNKHKVEYEAKGMDILAMMAFVPYPWLLLQVADADAVREITTNRAGFPKPVALYKLIFDLFGENVISTEGDEWKRHRRVVAKAFTEPNNKMVWQNTSNIVLDLFNMWDSKRDGSENGDSVVVEDVGMLMKDLALMVISSAAFGMTLSWKHDNTIPVGHRLAFKDTLRSVLNGMIHRIAFPDWVLNLYSSGRRTRIAFEELRVYMAEMIEARINAAETRQDLFSNLLKAREEEKDGSTLFSDDDLMGNIAILIFAGHDTTASTLAFALGLLSLYPDIQDKLLAQTNEVVSPGQLPTYAHVPKLTYALAIMQETLRLYPIVFTIAKISAQETSFVTQTASGNSRRVPVPAGTPVAIDIPGLHYNPKYWEEPLEFRPERFLAEYNKDAWAPFSLGPRGCIGRRFSEIETIATLTLFIMHYKIEVTEDPKFPPGTESFEEKQRRVLSTTVDSILMRPTKVPLTFKRRKISNVSQGSSY